MAQNRKIAGMTSSQIGILIGLGAVVCILFAVTGWLVFGGNIQLPTFSRPVENTPTPQNTSTPIVLSTHTPTPTMTPVPYEQLIPAGWKQFKTGLVEVWLPSSFKVVEPDPDEELSISATTSKNSLYTMGVTISYEPLTGGSLDAHLDAGLLQMDPQIRLTERRKVSLNSTDAVRMTFEVRVQSVDVNQLTYAMQDGSTVWFIYYVAQINEFYEILPIFEQSAKTFRVAK